MTGRLRLRRAAPSAVEGIPGTGVRWFHRVAGVLLLVLLPDANVEGQERVTPQELQAFDQVRIHRPDRGTRDPLIGSVTAISGDTLVVEHRVAGEVRVPLDRVARMEALGGGHPGKAFGIGLLAGGLVGTAWGLSECAPGSSTCDTPLFLATGAVGGLVGGGIGFLVGITRTWEPIELTQETASAGFSKPALQLGLSVPVPRKR